MSILSKILIKNASKSKKRTLILTCVLAAACCIFVALLILFGDVIFANTILLEQRVYKPWRRNPDQYTVYIQENDVYEPFLVLQNDYNEGATLLIRKYLIDENVPYNSRIYERRRGYYPTSDIDHFLNTDYIAKFPASIQAQLLDTSIVVASWETANIAGGARTTEEIRRKVFLLSATELGQEGRLIAVEGEQLEYYKTERTFHRQSWEKPKMIHTEKNGTADAFWLRSAYLWYDNLACVVAADGKSARGLTGELISAQPAFCLLSGTVLCKEEVDGKTVYVVPGEPTRAE